MKDRAKLAQEPDRVPLRRLVAIGLAALVVFGIGAAWTASVQRSATGSVRSDTAPRPEHAGEREVGLVYQRSFDEGIAATKAAEARRRLESAGWVDRDAGVVRVPIEQAMDLVARRGKL